MGAHTAGQAAVWDGVLGRILYRDALFSFSTRALAIVYGASRALKTAQAHACMNGGSPVRFAVAPWREVTTREAGGNTPQIELVNVGADIFKVALMLLG